MSIAGIKACSFFDDTPGSPTEGVVVQFNRVTEDSQCYTNGIAEKDFAGHAIHAGDESLLDIGVMDYDGKMDQMRAWMRAGTKLKFVAAGVQANILWYEPCEITLQEPTKFATGSRNVVRVKMMAEGGQHKIWKGVNIVYGLVITEGYATGWQDSNGNGLADGYGTNMANVTFTLGNQQNGHRLSTEPASGLITKTLPFPISGIQFTQSLNVTDLPDMNFETRLRIKDYANLDLVSDSETMALGRGSVQVTSPANTYYILCDQVFLAGTVNSTNFSYQDPALRVDGSDEYIAG